MSNPNQSEGGHEPEIPTAPRRPGRVDHVATAERCAVHANGKPTEVMQAYVALGHLHLAIARALGDTAG